MKYPDLFQKLIIHNWTKLDIIGSENYDDAIFMRKDEPIHTYLSQTNDIIFSVFKNKANGILEELTSINTNEIFHSSTFYNKLGLAFYEWNFFLFTRDDDNNYANITVNFIDPQTNKIIYSYHRVLQSSNFSDSRFYEKTDTDRKNYKHDVYSSIEIDDVDGAGNSFLMDTIYDLSYSDIKIMNQILADLLKYKKNKNGIVNRVFDTVFDNLLNDSLNASREEIAEANRIFGAISEIANEYFNSLETVHLFPMFKKGSFIGILLELDNIRSIKYRQNINRLLKKRVFDLDH